MKNKTRRLAAFLLSAAVVITAVPGMQERVYAQKTGGYTESPKSENVPVVQETKSRLKKAEAVPSAYMNKLSELTIRYPACVIRENMIRAGHFPQSDLRSLI